VTEDHLRRRVLGHAPQRRRSHQPNSCGLDYPLRGGIAPRQLVEIPNAPSHPNATRSVTAANKPKPMSTRNWLRPSSFGRIRRRPIIGAMVGVGAKGTRRTLIAM
jgi:hypothetical protein